MKTDYLSEFEQEFELAGQESGYRNAAGQGTGSSSEYSYEADEETDDAEWNNGSQNEFEADTEFETYTEFETGDEDSETDDNEAETDYAGWSRGGTYDRDREYGDRIYGALSGNYETELEMELELDAVLHEMERDYFFGGLKKWVKKKGFGLAKKFAKHMGAGDAFKALSSLARGDIRSLLKNKFLQSATQFIPGAGPAISKAMGIAGNLMNTVDAGRQKVQDMVEVGKAAYQNLAESLPGAQSEFEIRQMGKAAFQKAVTAQRKAPGAFAGMSRQEIPLPPRAHVTIYPGKVSINKGQQVIPLSPGAIVSMHPLKLIIHEKR